MLEVMWNYINVESHVMAGITYNSYLILDTLYFKF